MERKPNYHYNIGDIIKDEKRDLTIIDRKFELKKRKDGFTEIKKYYKYKCNKCGFDCGEHYTLGKELKNEFWAIEYKLECGHGCNCCCKPQRIIVPNINSFNATSPHLVKYLVNKEEGYKVSKYSRDEAYVKCDICGKEKTTTYMNMSANDTIGCTCGDGYSYPEKFTMSLLEQLGVKYIPQLSKKQFKWIENYRYDFYFKLNEEMYIIEVHGKQHPNTKYHDKKAFKDKKKTAEQERINDLNKCNLAIKNGIKPNNYIVIDCSSSDKDFIANNFINSYMSKIFDLSIIDWIKCDIDGQCNLMKKSCDLFNEGKNTDEIVSILNISKTSICNYLNKGTELNLCDFNGKKEHKRRCGEFAKNRIKPIKALDYSTGEFIGIYKNIKECIEVFQEQFNIKLSDTVIYGVIKGKYKYNRGYTFEYVTKDEYLDYINKI